LKLHEKGQKADRDRKNVLVEYDKLVKFFRLKPVSPPELAAMSAGQIYKLCEDTWNRQPTRRKLDYQEAMGISPRRNPLAYRWFVRDTLAFRQPASFAERLVIYVQLPFLYPGFLKRKRARMAAERAEAEKKMQDAAKAPKLELVKK